ncbi:SA1362 family protein [Pradoshia sp.]
MNRNKSSIIIYVLLGLAVLGLIYTLQFEAVSFIRSLLIGAVIIGVIYLVYRRFIMKGSSGNSGKERQAYQKAARVSSKKHKQDTMKPRRSKHHNTHGLTVISKETLINKPRKKSNIQLTVIEGKKARKKNRALF